MYEQGYNQIIIELVLNVSPIFKTQWFEISYVSGCCKKKTLRIETIATGTKESGLVDKAVGPACFVLCPLQASTHILLNWVCLVSDINDQEGLTFSLFV